MINVSWIADYNYCPLKLQLKYVVGEEGETYFMTIGKMQHEVRRAFEEITKRNMWGLKDDMNIREIRELLFEDVPQLVEDIFLKYQDQGLQDNPVGQRDPFYEDLVEDLHLESCFTAFKVKKILKWAGKPRLDVVDMLFPACLMEFSLESQELNLKGKIDKIEILEGYYYPVEFKSGKPPVKGVWKSHALQTAAYSLLIEDEFKKEVPIGFVDYLQIGERRTVILNNPLMEELFNVLSEMNSILVEGYAPEIVQNPNKCRACDYSDYCEYRND